MLNFSEIVSAADSLSEEEQENLLLILQRRIAEKNRARLSKEAEQSRVEYLRGDASPATVDEIMDEAGREA